MRTHKKEAFQQKQWDNIQMRKSAAKDDDDVQEWKIWQTIKYKIWALWRRGFCLISSLEGINPQPFYTHVRRWKRRRGSIFNHFPCVWGRRRRRRLFQRVSVWKKEGKRLLFPNSNEKSNPHHPPTLSTRATQKRVNLWGCFSCCLREFLRGWKKSTAPSSTHTHMCGLK